MLENKKYPNSYKVYYRRTGVALFIMTIKIIFCVVFLSLGTIASFYSNLLAFIFASGVLISLVYGEYLERKYIKSIKKRTIYQISKLSKIEFDMGLKQFLKDSVIEESKHRVEVELTELFQISRMIIR